MLPPLTRNALPSVSATSSHVSSRAFLLVITAVNIYQALSLLNFSKPPGPDDIPNVVLNMCASESSFILRLLSFLS